RHAPLGRYAITLRRVEAATEVHHNRIAAARAFSRGMAAFKPLVRDALLQSIAGLEEALALWRVAHDPSEEAGTLSEMGMMYIQLGDQRKATDCATQALTAARAARDGRREGSAIATLGVIQNNFGDKKTAIEYFDQALLLARESNDRSGEANILS